MVQERNVILYIILSIITCGLFSLFWFIVLADDIASLRGKPEPRGAFDLLISLITCGIYYMFCMYKYPQYLVEIQDEKGMRINDISSMSLVLAIFSFGIVSLALIQNELNLISQHGR
jgi:hypothetical protein